MPQEQPAVRHPSPAGWIVICSILFLGGAALSYQVAEDIRQKQEFKSGLGPGPLEIVIEAVDARGEPVAGLQFENFVAPYPAPISASGNRLTYLVPPDGRGSSELDFTRWARYKPRPFDLVAPWGERVPIRFKPQSHSWQGLERALLLPPPIHQSVQFREQASSTTAAEPTE